MDAVRHLVRALSTSARAVQAHTGISGAQLFILRQLAGTERPLSVNELADLTLTHQSTVSGVVTRLVERDLVTRVPAADDARRVEVALTARGRDLLVDAPPTAQTELVGGLARLAPAQRAALADALETWVAAAGLGGEPASLFFEREPLDAAAQAARSGRGRRRVPRATARGGVVKCERHQPARVVDG